MCYNLDMIILLHSSKTMKRGLGPGKPLRQPQLLKKAERLANYLKTLSVPELGQCMKISSALAQKTQGLLGDWSTEPESQTMAMDSFLGDIYSGLQVPGFSQSDRTYADKVLRILSGLYGILRPGDGICPYRLEMGYKLPEPEFSNLYKYWGKSVAECLPGAGLVLNLAAEEYFNVVAPFLDGARVVTPKFLTVNPKTGEPSFVVVHAKVARGAFARWLIQHRIEDAALFVNFQEIGYRYDKSLSTKQAPVFVCKEFGGKGLSIKKLS